MSRRARIFSLAAMLAVSAPADATADAAAWQLQPAQSGRGAVRTWVDVDRGQLSGATADIVLADVQATLGRGLTPLALQSASGRLGGKRLEGGFEFQTEGLQFETREGQRWPGGNVFVGWTQADGKTPASGELRADKLDLAALAQVATRLPLVKCLPTLHRSSESNQSSILLQCRRLSITTSGVEFLTVRRLLIVVVIRARAARRDHALLCSQQWPHSIRQLLIACC